MAAHSPITRPRAGRVAAPPLSPRGPSQAEHGEGAATPLGDDVVAVEGQELQTRDGTDGAGKNNATPRMPIAHPMRFLARAPRES
ncbi:MAG TPA: hypothetical protein VM142_01510 [Acidimicrobiales bacterium]|nr:hypothetical protein [Acidimicrobiales bacterium]